MANLFNTYLRIINSKKNNNFTNDQVEYIDNIVNGNQKWASLEELAKTNNTEQLKNLKESLESEIYNSPLFSFRNLRWNIKYNKLLKSILKDVNGAINQALKLTTFSSKNEKKYSKFAKRMDDIYGYCKQEFSGTIMLPVIQTLEPRIGNSNGECFGYVAEWAAGILKSKRAFGIGIDQKKTLQPISFNSKLARKNPEINHFGRLTNKISLYQKLQSSVNKLTEELQRSIEESQNNLLSIAIKYFKNSEFVFFSSTDDLAQTMIDKAKIDPTKVYNLNILAYSGGHALGFYFNNSRYHFFDSNSGWYRFDKEADFKNWFVYYFKKRGYQDHPFREYAISSYSISTINEKAESSRDKNFKWSLSEIIIFAAISPIIATYMAYIITNHFIIRGAIYLALKIKGYLKQRKEKPDHDTSVVVQELTSVDDIPKSLHYLDLSISPDNAEKKVVSSSNVMEYLDLETPDKQNKSTLSKSFFKVPNIENTEDTKDTIQFSLSGHSS